MHEALSYCCTGVCGLKVPIASQRGGGAGLEHLRLDLAECCEKVPEAWQADAV